MNTKLVMTSSAIVMGIVGIILTFIPDETLKYLEIDTNQTALFIMQILGALYFSFAMLNWMHKANLIGGIYNRPVAVANLTHYAIAGLALLKGLISNPGLPYIIWAAGITYFLLGVSFAIILYRHPIRETSGNA